jgi:hypothetical protein
VITPQFITKLDTVNFFDYFFPKTLESVYAQAQDAAVILVDTMARIAWANGYIYFIAYLPALLMSGGFLAPKGLVAAIVLGKATNAEGTYAPAIPYFIRANLADAVIRSQWTRSITLIDRHWSKPFSTAQPTSPMSSMVELWHMETREKRVMSGTYADFLWRMPAKIWRGLLRLWG